MEGLLACILGRAIEPALFVCLVPSLVFLVVFEALEHVSVS